MDETTTLFASLAIITPFAVIDSLASIPSNLAFVMPLLAIRRPMLTMSVYTLGVFLKRCTVIVPRRVQGGADPLDLLLRLRAHAGALPPDLGAWLEGGIDRVLSGTVPNLEAGLCLGGHGIDRPFPRWRRRRRDDFLRAAGAFCPYEIAWRKAKRLAAEVRRYESRVAPRWRGLEHPPKGARPIYTAWSAWGTGYRHEEIGG